MLRRALLTACLLLAPVSAVAKTTREADLAFRDAKSSHGALKKDTARRKFRHHWLNVADKYEGVARGHPKTDRAPEALFAAAQMLEELSRISRNQEDLLRAASDYRRVVELAPRHGLADDAALEVARIQADLLGRPEDARRTAERALKQLPSGDKTRELRALLAALPADKRRKTGGGDGKGAPREALLAAMARMGAQETGQTPGSAVSPASTRAPTGEPRAVDAGGAVSGRDPSAHGAASAGRGAPAAGMGSERNGGAGAPGKDKGGTEASGTAPAARADRTDTDAGAHGARPGQAGGEAPAVRADRGAGRVPSEPRDEGSHGGATSAAEARRSDERGSGMGSAAGVPFEGRDGSASSVRADRAAARADADPGAAAMVDGGARAAGQVAAATGAADGLPDTLRGVPKDLPVVRAAPKPAEPAPVSEKRLGTREARARLKAMGGVKDAEVTLAEQLGLKVRRVIIDPGHGGHDSGALGPTGKKEKDVSLAISRKLASRLRAEGLEVLLTRERDSFVRLEDRAQFANEHRGDLFISVHCNSATSRKLRGVETYSLNIASDRYSIRLAARENASSEKSISDLQFILADLATKANTEESTHLATRVQKALVESLAAKDAGLRDLGHKQALFYVLLGAKMPAILVETSFISNPEDERRLASSKYQDQVAAAIADGVRAFLDNRDRVAQVE